MANNYEVGYGRPPKTGQFKPGQSGNNKGRPKGRKNVNPFELIDKELACTIPLKDGSKITKAEAAIKQLCNKASGGDFKSGKLLFDIIARQQPAALAREFLGKLIKEGILTERSVKDYLNSGTLLNPKAIPDAVYKLYYGTIYGRAQASTTMLSIVFLASIRWLFYLSSYYGHIREAVAIEYSFWQGIDRTLDVLKVNGEERAKHIKKIERERKYKRPSELMYDTAVKLHHLWTLDTMISFNNTRDAGKSVAGYEDVEKQWLNDEIQKHTLARGRYTMSQDEMDDLKYQLEIAKRAYISFREAPDLNKKDLAILREEPLAEGIRDLVDWYENTSKA